MSNITWQVYPKSDLEKMIDHVKDTIRESLTRYVGHGAGELTGENLSMRLETNGELTVYYKPVIPLKNIQISYEVMPG